ncbi:MAG TPA: DUF418 domain-containing protein [Vicinamibacterales bacterium]
MAVTRPAPPAGPVSTDERLRALDILRGIALFGMILVHFHQRTRREMSGLDDLIGWGVYIFVEQKAWGTFAFLFGAGFAILLRRLERRGAPVVSTYLRRMAALALFGIVADVCFGFHILFSYACWGLVLLLIRGWSTRALLLTAAIAAAARTVVGEFTLLTGVAAAPSTPPELFQAVQAAAEHSDYLTLLSARWALFIGSFPHGWRGFLPDINLALFILGLLAVRHGLLDSPVAHRRPITRWMVLGAVAWACSWLVLGQLATLGVDAHWPVVYGFGLLQDQWLCLTYIGAMLLLLAYRPIWVNRLALFGYAGRMALTNYMLQAAALDALSSGYGWGLRLRPMIYLPAAIVLFGAEAALSRAWLTRFRTGPLEWVWRTITYAAPQPLARINPMPKPDAVR